MKTIGCLLVLFSFSLINPGHSQACTTAVLHSSGSKLVAKSYDWSNDQGIVVANRRGITKRAMSTSKDANHEPKTWTSIYASITFNQYGRDFANGGMNEKGLVVEMMEMEPSPSYLPDGKEVVSQLQWIQFVLDSYSTVDEVAQAVPNVGIEQNFVKGHFMVCDTNECAAVEVIPKRGLQIKRGNDLGITRKDGVFIPVPVLANDHYDCSLKALTNYQGFGGDAPIPSGPYCQNPTNDRDWYCDAACRDKYSSWRDANSVERFVRAAAGIQNLGHGSSDAVQDLFDVLNNVYDGGGAKGQGGTRWQIVYDQLNMKIYWRTDADGTDANGFNARPRALDFNRGFAATLDCSKGKTQMVGVLPANHEGPTQTLGTCDAQGKCPWKDFDQDINTQLVSYSGTKKPINKNFEGFRDNIHDSFPWMSLDDAKTVALSIWGGYVSGYTTCGGKVTDDQVGNLYMRAARPFISQHVRKELPATVSGKVGGKCCNSKGCFIPLGCYWDDKTCVKVTAKSVKGLKSFNLNSIVLSKGMFTFTADLDGTPLTGNLDSAFYCDLGLTRPSTHCRETFSTPVKKMDGGGSYTAKSSAPGRVCFKDVKLENFEVHTGPTDVKCGKCDKSIITHVNSYVCSETKDLVNVHPDAIGAIAGYKLKAVLRKTLPGYFPRCPQ